MKGSKIFGKEGGERGDYCTSICNFSNTDHHQNIFFDLIYKSPSYPSVDNHSYIIIIKLINQKIIKA
jgi:hypothetical protein